MSMDCDVLETPDYADRPGTQESPEVAPYCLKLAMHDLLEQNTSIGTYWTCIHWTVHVPYE